MVRVLLVVFHPGDFGNCHHDEQGEVMNQAEIGKRVIERVRSCYDAEEDAGRVTWVDMLLADTLADALTTIQDLTAKVEALEAKLQESKTP
ncbi:MAG: hypothetical protein KDE59_11460 [Anaerolineales bacterium]|nr:hypothetical protein [Anaerolineales bacterium]